MRAVSRYSMTPTTHATSTLTTISEPKSSRWVSLMVRPIMAGESCRARVPRLEPVPQAPDGLDQLTRGAELGAQALDVHVDGACLDVGRGIPHRFQQVATRLYPTAPLGEGQQELELRRGQIDIVAVDAPAVGGPIDGNSSTH